LGVLGISLDDLSLLSVADVLNALKWRQYYDTKTSEGKIRNDWEQTRLLAAYVISPYRKERLENVSDLFPFEWDDAKPKFTEHDLELMAEQRRKMDAQVIAEYNGRK
jgi:hypothetical protein